ncbi:PDGLE domain-containing protein [Nocardia tenerifensis]|uniref:PDGLE domain-containing protein n=1 Tax=Nocardia tenerifensis TaxID=228006 RepID=UPI0027E5007E|nr:PDGLE domain-containing protein [Nocardia tenerifensis]
MNGRRRTDATPPRLSLTGFLLAFAAVAVLVAGLLSYVASSEPDGLDATTQRGCTVVQVDGGEQLEGDCIAKNARDHHLAKSPLAGYTIDGDDTLTGVAGVLGVVAAFAVLFAVVNLIRTGRNTAARGRRR